MFKQTELIAPNTSAEAEATFQQGRAHDIDIKMQFPDSIPPHLRELAPDRAKARQFYRQAADMGHVDAMNNLAYYEQMGFGLDDERYPANPIASFNLNFEMARRDDARGFIGMAGHYQFGTGVAHDPDRAESCLVEAARRDNLRGIILLAEHDLGLRHDDIPDAPDPATVPRGIALMEEVSRRGDPTGYDKLADFFAYKVSDPIKREFYAREATKMEPGSNPRLLVPLYNDDTSPLFDPKQAECLSDLKDADMTRLDELCPRPDGTLTREVADLPAAPNAPYDLSTLRSSFAER